MLRVRLHMIPYLPWGNFFQRMIEGIPPTHTRSLHLSASMSPLRSRRTCAQMRRQYVVVPPSFQSPPHSSFNYNTLPSCSLASPVAILRRTGTTISVGWCAAHTRERRAVQRYSHAPESERHARRPTRSRGRNGRPQEVRTIPSLFGCSPRFFSSALRQRFDPHGASRAANEPPLHIVIELRACWLGRVELAACASRGTRGSGAATSPLALVPLPSSVVIMPPRLLHAARHHQVPHQRCKSWNRCAMALQSRTSWCERGRRMAPPCALISRGGGARTGVQRSARRRNDGERRRWRHESAAVRVACTATGVIRGSLRRTGASESPGRQRGERSFCTSLQ
ncbi:hypothetical protein B0H10DRAFT_298380 [Mycena sp. CBHHK59/15]|nr:hypothetical protein B0H10DRAFT_298380 [Mycena sp. CBHHK59/15]